MSAKFVDLGGKEAEAGKTGELWLKGPNVFQGCRNRTRETQMPMTSDGYFMTRDIGHSDKHGNCYTGYKSSLSMAASK
ncbi:hypothetical protein LTS07_009281 [Exophiala sideris]|nr:hypothetical protein LTS07_009281 [Exophiala sideris]